MVNEIAHGFSGTNVLLAAAAARCCYDNIISMR
jgi:hypothetical protein